VEFYTGLINHQPMGFYSVHTLMQDAKRHGLRILPVSCVHSAVATTVIDDHTLRLGLHRVKGLGSATAARIVADRSGKPFASLADFLLRVSPNEKERRLLAKAGALNDLPAVEHWRDGLWQVELPLYNDLITPETAAPVLAMMTPAERLAADFTIQGASTGPHPMKLWRERSGKECVSRATDLHGMSQGTPVLVAGMAICRQRPGTAKGHCFISLEDETGIANLFVPKKTFQRLKGGHHR
jgi:error-prone DNA polymerase